VKEVEEEQPDIGELCIEACERIQAILHRLHDRRHRKRRFVSEEDECYGYNADCEPTLEEVVADMWACDESLNDTLLRPVFLSGRSPVMRPELDWEKFQFRCMYDLVFALHALTLA
jgi:hypothetical protein